MKKELILTAFLFASILPLHAEASDLQDGVESFESPREFLCNRSDGVIREILKNVGRLCFQSRLFHLNRVVLMGLHGNDIGLLRENDFRGLNALKTLRMGNLVSKAFYPDLFKPLQSLESLTLISDQVRQYPKFIFDDLPTLKSLQLYSDADSLKIEPDSFTLLQDLMELEITGKLFSLPTTPFSQLRNLRYLSLAARYKLEGLDVSVLFGLENLTHLRIINTNITALPLGVFDNSPKLEFLKIHKGYFSNLHVNLLRGLTELRFVKLSYNQFTTVPLGFFQNNPKLEVIGLSSDKITSLQEGLFDNLPKLREIRLRMNLMDPTTTEWLIRRHGSIIVDTSPSVE